MRPLVTGQFRCSTQNAANQTATFITNRINQMQNFELTEPVTARPWHGVFLVNFSILAENATAADNLYDFVLANWDDGSATATRILNGSTIKRTNNFDDEGQVHPDEVLREATKT